MHLNSLNWIFNFQNMTREAKVSITNGKQHLNLVLHILFQLTIYRNQCLCIFAFRRQAYTYRSHFSSLFSGTNHLHVAPDRQPCQHLITQFLQAGYSSWRPPTVSKHWRQSCRSMDSKLLVHGQVTIIFVVSVCLCRVFLSRLWSDFDHTRTHVICLGLVAYPRI